MTVLIEVNPKAVDYFRRRKIYPTQEIRAKDGVLYFSIIPYCFYVKQTEHV